MANGAFGGGNGTLENPYLVEDSADLNAVRDFVTQQVHFLQVADIDLKGIDWTPIGDYSVGPFMGSYDGGLFKISNLSTDPSLTQFSGLFGFTLQATITNVVLVNVNISGNKFVGGLVGMSDQSHISNCFSSGSITGKEYVGGLVGYQTGGTTEMCASSGNVNGGKFIGGLIGQTEGSSLSNLRSFCEVTSDDDHIGGLVGFTSFSTSITNCLATGKVSTTHSFPEYAEPNDYVGGLIGRRHDDITLLSSYYNSDTSGTTDTGKGEPKTTAELTDLSTFVGWDFENVWVMTDNGPELKSFYTLTSDEDEDPDDNNDTPSDIVIVTDVNFAETKMIRDRLGSPIPQVWDHENKRWVPVTLQMVLFMANSKT